MLVLRKEIKIGIGAGLTILGIAAVYGLIAALSSSGGDAKKDLASNSTTAALTDRGNEGGLPPKVDEPDPLTTPKTETAARDPFAESVRKDGNTTTDPWSNVLSSGKVSSEVKPPVLIKSPTDAKGGTDGKLVVVPPNGGEKKIVSPLDSVHKTPVKTGGNDASVPGGKYVVQAGDTFSTIANKVYGSKKYSQALIKANPDVNPSRLRIGKEIAVPPKEQVATVGGSVGRDAAEITAPIDASRQYRVASGDTLSRISTKVYGTSTKWEELYAINKTLIGSEPGRLKVGTLIDLPQKSVR